MADTLRAFFALPVREVDKPALLEAQGRMKRAAESGRLDPRWIAAEQLHVTLKFLGEVSKDHVPALTETLRRRASLHAAFDTSFCGVIAFGGVRRARTLVAGLSPDGERVTRLAHELEGDVEPLGIPRETRAFVPHVSLARIKRPGDATEIVEAAKLELVPAHFDELVLYQSVLGPAGGVYTALGRAAFQG